MLKCASAGALGAAIIVGLALALGCGAILGPAVCGSYRGVMAERWPATIKSAARHEFNRANGVPRPYRGMTNPIEPSIATVLSGADAYDLRCAVCHGPMGLGDGRATDKLRQRPADLAGSMSNPATTDDFLYWTIAEGGAAFGTDMPPYKSDLSEVQIWEIVTYMRAAFKGQEPEPPAVPVPASDG